MKIVFDKKFAKATKRLPQHYNNKLIELVTILEHDPEDIRLHAKQLAGPLAGCYSFRVGRKYRCIFRYLNEHTIILDAIKHRKDIYRT